MLKLKLQYFGQLMRRADSLEKTLMLGKIEGRRKRATEPREQLERQEESHPPEKTRPDSPVPTCRDLAI